MSTPIDDGGPAFPFGQVSEITGQPINGFFNPGMSLRDWFAGQALMGMLADPNNIGSDQTNATAAYKMADAMITARKKGPQP